MFAKLAVKYKTSNPLELKAAPSSLPPSSTGSSFAFGSMSASKNPFGGGNTTAPFGAAVGAPTSMTGAAPVSNSSPAFGIDDKSIFGSTTAGPPHAKSPFGTIGTVPAFGTGTVGSTLSPFGGSSSTSSAAQFTAATSQSSTASVFGAGVEEKKSVFGAASSQNKSPFNSTSAIGTGTGGSTLSPFGGASSSAFGGLASSAATPFSSNQFGFTPSASGTTSGLISSGASALISAKFGGRNPRDILASFYQTHNPSKVNEVDTLLNKYAGREEQMFLNLAKKYNLDPSMFGVSTQPIVGPSTGAATFGSPASMGFGGAAGFGGAPAGGFGGGTFGSSSGFGSIAQGGGFGNLASSSGGGGFAGSGGGATPSTPFGAAPFGSARR